ncbi:MAG: hypothetical protein AB9M60_22610 [Leptothrix sp. (in: b-proteobacteria)]
MFDTPKRRAPTALMLALLSAAPLCATPAQASCGAATCSLMTDRFTQGTEPHLGWGADLRLEQVNQTRLRTGSTSLRASDVTTEPAIEARTRNLTLQTTVSYGFNADWSLALRAPFVRRDHQHATFDVASQAVTGAERWTFSAPGDVQVLARRQLPVDLDGVSSALSAGLKLPSGSTTEANADGSRAERALQPGTGTTDLVLGSAYRMAFGLTNAAFFQATLAAALHPHQGYRPGNRVELSGGWSHAYTPDLGVALQLNWRRRGHDSGVAAEPDNSGSVLLDLSPGLTVGLGRGTTAYGYVQLPLLQHVSGIQLVPRHALAVGLTHDY